MLRRASVMACFSLLVGVPAQASEPKPDWVALFDGAAGGEDYGSEVRVDKAGNVYVVGQSVGVGTGFDFVTLKYDRHGKLLWSRRYDGPASGDDVGFLIDLDPAGNVIVAGDSEGIGTSMDIAVVKYDPTGNLEWVRRYDGPASDWDATQAGRTLAVDVAGNALVCGTSLGLDGSYDAVTFKLAPDGNFLWERRYEGPAKSFDDTYSIAVDPALNVYVAGDTYNASGNEDFLVLKYDAAGNLLWARQWDSPDHQREVMYAIALDGAANVYVTGYSEGVTTNADFATVKYDAAGNLLWARRMDGGDGGLDIPFAIATTPQGEVAVVGEAINAGGWNVAMVVKYDAAGNQQWVRTYLDPGWIGMNSFTDVTFDGHGRVLVTGSTWAGFPTSTNGITIAYEPNGDLGWELHYDGPAHGGDATWSLELDGRGSVYLTGVGLGASLTTDVLTIKLGLQTVPGGNTSMR